MKLRPDVRDCAHRIATAGYRALTRDFHPEAEGERDELERVNSAASCLRALIDNRWTPMPSPEPPDMGYQVHRIYASTVDGRVAMVMDIDSITCIETTSVSICCLFGQEPVWFPIRELGDRSQVRSEGDRGVLTISRWIAQQKGLL